MLMAQVLSVHRIVEDLRVELFRRRISQEQLATSTSMSRSMISRRLNGEVEPTLSELESLAAAAGLRVRVELVASEVEQ